MQNKAFHPLSGSSTSYTNPMHIYFYLGIVFLMVRVFPVVAQEDPRFRKPLDIKAPVIKKDTSSHSKEASEKPIRKPGFEPRKELSIVSEDTSTLDEGILSVVEVSEEHKIDCVWVKIADYYAIWDSRNVNPYHMDPTQFNDTVEIELYNQEKNQLWAPPLTSSMITSNFGQRGYRWHYGTDLELDTGDSVRAAFDGIVRIVRFDAGGWGNYILLRHYNGLETLYGHLSKQLVEGGQMVKAGELIGFGGSTGRSSGPHLHYEVRYQGNAINPTLIYDFEKNTLYAPLFVLTPEHFAYFSNRKTAVVRRTVYHKVKTGDTLSRVARNYGTTVAAICRMNRISTRAKLRLGQRLRVK
jgi:hypothetical protein